MACLGRATAMAMAMALSGAASLSVGATSELPEPPYTHPGIIVSKPMLDQIRAQVMEQINSGASHSVHTK